MKKILTMLILLNVILLSACSSNNYKPVNNITKLDVSFADLLWNGKVIPSGHECKKYGGIGYSPKLVVKNIPKQANAIVVEFNDQDYKPLSYGGGHGSIWVPTKGQSEIIIPQVKSETNLPQGVNVENYNRSNKSTGVYLSPCSGGRGNLYFADVKAVYKATNKGEQSKLIAEGKIILGRY